MYWIIAALIVIVLVVMRLSAFYITHKFSNAAMRGDPEEMLNLLSQVYDKSELAEMNKQMQKMQQNIGKEMAEYCPPNHAEIQSVEKWEKYWHKHLSSEDIDGELGDDLFMTIDLVSTLNKRSVKTVFCAGNGVSLEPIALAYAGFDVLAVDLSPSATRYVSSLKLDSANIKKLHGVKEVIEGNIHSPGGKVEFITGSFTDERIYKQKYDAIISRKTIQLFPMDLIEKTLGIFLDNLSKNGILILFFINYTEPLKIAFEWLKKNGFELIDEEYHQYGIFIEVKYNDQVVQLMLGTG